MCHSIQCQNPQEDYGFFVDFKVDIQDVEDISSSLMGLRFGVSSDNLYSGLYYQELNSVNFIVMHNTATYSLQKEGVGFFIEYCIPLQFGFYFDPGFGIGISNLKYTQRLSDGIPHNRLYQIDFDRYIGVGLSKKIMEYIRLSLRFDYSASSILTNPLDQRKNDFSGPVYSFVARFGLMTN